MTVTAIAKSAAPKATTPSAAAQSIQLPTAKSGPVQEANRITILLYGPGGIGKSTWASMAPDPLMLATEPGLNHLTAYKLQIEGWKDLLYACAKLAEGNPLYKTIVLDTVDNALLFCRAYVQERDRIADLGDDNNKGHALVNNEFHRVMTKLAQLPYGLVLVSHSQEVEVKTRTKKYTKVVPTLSAKARQIVLQLVDVVLYCDLEVTTEGDHTRETRVIRTKPTTEYEAKDRTGLLPESLPLEYGAFLGAWHAAKAAKESGGNNGSATRPQTAELTTQEGVNA